MFINHQFSGDIRWKNWSIFEICWDLANPLSWMKHQDLLLWILMAFQTYKMQIKLNQNQTTWRWKSQWQVEVAGPSWLDFLREQVYIPGNLGKHQYLESSKVQRKQQSRHEPWFHVVKSENLRNCQKTHQLAAGFTNRRQGTGGSSGIVAVAVTGKSAFILRICLSQLNKIARSDAKNIGKYHLIFSLGRTLSKYRITMVISETPTNHPRKREIYPKKRLTVENPGIDLRPWSSCFSRLI